MSPLPLPFRLRLALSVCALWLSCAAQTHAAADSVLVFNEIHYHPKNANDTEWLELHSLQGVNVDISGWKLEGGVDFTFPNGTVVPGRGFIVVAATPAGLPGVAALGPWEGKIDNDGEEIRLVNNSGRVMDRVSFGDSGDWPVGPDASGATLAKVDQESADSGPSHWTTSAKLGGTPGASNFTGAPPAPVFVFNEITGANDPQFRIELLNRGIAPADLGGYKIMSSSGASTTLPPQTVPGGGYAVITGAQLGFAVLAGERLFLLEPSGIDFEDAREVTNRLRGRAVEKGGDWLFPNGPTFGEANTFSFNTAIVLNELMYNPHPGQAAQEQWIEITNRSGTAWNLTGWKLTDGVNFAFPADTVLAPGQYLVVASNPATFATNHPGVTALGPFSGSLSGAGERVRLEDAAGNPVDELRYFDDGRWAAFADSGGSSLERRDPRAESSAPETWAASDESGRAPWQTITYRGSGANIGNDPTQWHEFIFGLLSKGSFLIDDIRVTEDPDTNNRQLIQNGDFSSGAATAWRMLGTHRHATVVDDGGNKVLRVDASGFTEHMHNHAETTLKDANGYVTINSGKMYEISFRARWLAGNNLLNSRLYFNRLARTTPLAVSRAGGTPGAVNSRALENLGPTYRQLSHAPAVPVGGQPATVSVRPSDPDGIASLTLLYSINGGVFNSTPMADGDGDGIFTGTIPGQASSAKVQFYVQAADTAGATSFFPAKGPASRALIPWNDGQATGGSAAANRLRITMLTADTNFLHDVTQVMSDDELGATVIYRESEIYYDVGVRLKGSERGRSDSLRVGWHLRFAPHDAFLGAHNTIAIDRSGAGSQFSQKEILVIHSLNRAGNIPGSYDDLIRVIAPRSTHTGSAMLQKARFSDEFLDNQWENGADGPMFEYELIYYPTTTNRPTSDPTWTEGLKLPQPDNVAGVGVNSLGPATNKELYRWHYLQKNRRQADDYSKIIAAVTAMGLSQGSQFYTETRAKLDVDQWLRAFAIQFLFGIGDSYGTGGQHNATFYVRPGDGKTLYFPKDMDFTFSQSSSSGISAGDLDKLIGDPGNRRAYYGHLRDIISRSFNSAYLTPWAQHYQTYLGGENLTQWMSYIDQRVASVQSQINSAVPPPAAGFVVTTNGGQPITTASSFVTLQGSGWVDIREIRLAGSSQPLAVTWITTTSWRVNIPVASGTQTVTLDAVGFNGAVLGTTNITVTSTATPTWAALRINEWLAANKSFRDPADGDADDWIEIYNPTATAVSLESWRLSDGAETYVLPAGVSVAAGGYLLIWADDEMIQNSGTGQIHVPFKLSADGESITLQAPDGTRVDHVSFGPQRDDVSEGRFSDGAELVTPLTIPTPRVRNLLTAMTNLARTGSVTTLTFSTAPGVRYQVEASTDLVNWLPLGLQQVATGNVLTVEDDSGSALRRFYRVRVQP